MMRKNECLLYVRYADDIFTICKKGYKLKLFLELNAPKKFEYTIENSKNQRLSFLDTEIYFSDKTSNLEMQHFEKSTKSKTTLNFNSIAPKRHKLNTIIGGCHRIQNATSNNLDRKISLEKFEDKLVLNDFPRNLVKSVINETLENLENEIEKPKPEKELFLSLAFTDCRCDSIGAFLRKAIQKYLPDFKLTIAWRCIRVEQKILPKLKPISNNKNDPPAVVYRFKCPCDEIYIGQTKKPISERILQHQQPSRPSHIRTHTEACQIFKNSQSTAVGRNPSQSTRHKFFKERFSVIQKHIFDSFTREQRESVAISIEKPSINVQKDSQKYLTIL